LFVPDSKGKTARWSHNATLCLLAAYEEKEKLLKSNTVRRSEAWKEVAEYMAAAGFDKFTADQCDNKFHNLKKTYLKKKDNMGAGSSGHERMDFTYFDEFDKLLGKSPIVNPVSVASSSRTDHNISNPDPIDLDSSEDYENMSIEQLEALCTNLGGAKKKSGKKRNIDLVVDAIQDIDAKKEKRHNEIVSVLKQGQEDFKVIMSQFVGVLTPRQRQASGGSDDE
jgi:Myb/SANT-like DNA-binding domain